MGVSTTCAAWPVLGLAEDATDQQIKRAYRKMSLQYHPDKNQGDAEAARRFAEINQAYEVGFQCRQPRPLGPSPM